MGNCHAAEAAAVVIQHPGGKVERLYGPATAADVMRSNPGHCVALVVLRVSAVAKQDPGKDGGGGATRITKVKLLKPKDALLLGHVYRLITSQEVAKAVQARRLDKLRRREEAVDDRGPAAASREERQSSTADPAPRARVPIQERKRPEKDRHRSAGSGGGRHWQPSLRSISEFPS